MVYIQPMTLYEAISLVISLVVFMTVLVTTGLLIKQTREMTTQTRFVAESLKDSAYENIRTLMMTINQIFINQPELRPYFYLGKEITNDDELLQQKLAAISEAILDLFESILLHREHFPQIWPADEWDAYIKSVFANSPVLCGYLESNKDWYIPDLMHLKEKIETQRQQDRVQNESIYQEVEP